MLRATLLFAVSLSLINANGQTNVYHPFPDAAYWRVDYHHNQTQQVFCSVRYYFQYTIEADTLINSQVYKKILRSFVQEDILSCAPPATLPAIPSTGYVGALRDDPNANKAFIVLPNATEDSLLYDYGLVVGDTLKGLISEYYFNNNVVTIVDSVEINGQYRKRWIFDNCSYPSDPHFPYIIQGVGSSAGLFDPLCTWTIDFTQRYLACVVDSSGTLFDAEYSSSEGCELITGIGPITRGISATIHPNPFSKETYLHTETPLQNATLSIYNALGQLVQETSNINGQSVSISREGLSSAIHFVQLRDGKGSYVGKVLIEDL